MRSERTIFLRAAAAALALLLAGGSTFAAVAAPSPLTGTVFAGADRRPLARATIHLSPVGADSVVSSGPTDAHGNFSFESVPAATYEVAVEFDGGLYLVAAPVEVGPGEPLVLNLAIEKAATPPVAVPQSRRGAGGLFATPLAATLIVAGSAIAVGAVIESTTSSDTDPVASEFLTR